MQIAEGTLHYCRLSKKDEYWMTSYRVRRVLLSPLTWRLLTASPEVLV